MFVNLFTEKVCKIWLQMHWGPEEELGPVPVEQDLTLYNLEPEPKKKPASLSEALKEASWETGGPGPEPPDEVDPGYPLGPDWLVFDILDQGISELILPDWENLPDWAAWCLRHGLAPTQKFQLVIPRPHYFQHWDGEYDVDYFWDLGLIEPMAPANALREWERYLKNIELVIP